MRVAQSRYPCSKRDWDTLKERLVHLYLPGRQESTDRNYSCTQEGISPLIGVSRKMTVSIGHEMLFIFSE